MDPLRIVLLLVGAATALQTADAGTFQGEGTYYGDNGWAGSCMGNVRWTGGVYNAGAWPPPDGQFTRIALNSRQYSTNMCGKKLMFRGTGQGLGHSPISTSWQVGMVTNLCPECQYGDLDMGISGDGRWKIEWYWLNERSSGLTTEARSVQRAVSSKKSGRRNSSWRKYLAKKRASRKRRSKPKSSHWGRVWKRVKARSSKSKMMRMLRKHWAKKRAQRGRKLLIATF